MTRVSLWVLAAGVALALPATSSAQIRRYPLESASGLRLHNVAAALWVGPGTVAHFRNLTVNALPTDAAK